jgi:RNA recognition motif-containing protein
MAAIFHLLQDIREAFPDLGIVSVTIERNDGRYKASAKLTLDYPELLDDWPESRQNVFVRNKEVSVCVGNSDGWLCVAKLPLSYSDEEFFNLACAYGKVREAFLMISERTGDSKGYGLIKYVSSEAAAQARHLLDGRTVTGGRDNPHDLYKLDCDWLNSAHISFGSLHSKALYVDHLPPNFRDMNEFRRLFAVKKAPPYCQIAMPKGVIQDWGLVEFFNPIDTEETQVATNLTLFHGRRIRTHFCIPGVNAINIYMQVCNII